LENSEILTTNSSRKTQKNPEMVWLDFDLPKSTPKGLRPPKLLKHTVYQYTSKILLKHFGKVAITSTNDFLISPDKDQPQWLSLHLPHEHKMLPLRLPR